MRKNGLMSDIPNTPARTPPIINPDFLTGMYVFFQTIIDSSGMKYRFLQIVIELFL